MSNHIWRVFTRIHTFLLILLMLICGSLLLLISWTMAISKRVLRVLTRPTFLLISLLVCGSILLLRNGQIGEHFSDVDVKCNYRRYILGPGGEQSDPCLIEIVQNELLIPPSKLEYNITVKGDGSDDIRSNKEKVQLLKMLLVGNFRNRFFIECGANDGQFISATLTLEKTYQWTGLLVEANPTEFARLQSRNRKAWAINAAACITPYAERVTLYVNTSETGLASLHPVPKRGVTTKVSVHCIPIFTMLQALNRTVVDFFSLDTEGSELDILKTIPFDKVEFKVLSVEHVHIPGKRRSLQQFLESKGYIFIKDVLDYLTLDSVFVHESLKGRALQLGLITEDVD